MICIYAANIPVTLTSANIGVKFGLKNIVIELISERKIYTKSELSALRPRMACWPQRYHEDGQYERSNQKAEERKGGS